MKKSFVLSAVSQAALAAVVAAALVFIGCATTGDAASFLKSGDSYLNRGDYDKAIADYTRAIEIDPRDAVAYENRGIAYTSKGDIDRAVADFTQAISIDPLYAGTYFNRGCAYDEQGDYDKAIADYTQTISIDPMFAGAYHNRGFDYNEKGDYDKAIADYTQVISIYPNDANTYLNRGVAYGKKGDINRAKTDWETAVKLDPNNATAKENLEMLQKEFGNSPASATSRVNTAEFLAALDESTESSFSNIISLGKPFDDSLSGEFPMHVYRITVPEGITAVDIYSTGIDIKIAALTGPGVATAARSEQPSQKEILGANYTNSSTGIRMNVPVPQDRRIFLWVTDVKNKTGQYSITTKANLPYPAPFEGTWQYSQAGQMNLQFSGNAYSVKLDSTPLGMGTYTYTDDMITFTITHKFNNATQRLDKIPGGGEIKFMSRYTMTGKGIKLNLKMPYTDGKDMDVTDTYDWVRK
jgi:tetratricopeptide (TPR) repeat protein